VGEKDLDFLDSWIISAKHGNGFYITIVDTARVNASLPLVHFLCAPTLKRIDLGSLGGAVTADGGEQEAKSLQHIR
jgi:hypothetical protein